jgi:hypothetical protein
MTTKMEKKMIAAFYRLTEEKVSWEKERKLLSVELDAYKRMMTDINVCGGCADISFYRKCAEANYRENVVEKSTIPHNHQEGVVDDNPLGV